MRFLELQVDNFGPLKGLSFEMHADIFVVLGHNEAGKSSFHAALESILYGFEVNSRDKHPLAQFRSGEDLELRAKVQLDDATIMNVRRVLMAQGKLEIMDKEGQVIHSWTSNGPLPAMQSVPRSLFQAVYSLTANDTDMQRDDVRGHIRELLLGETGLRGARPISQVRGEVEGDMLALWREDQRGTPVAKDLRKQLKQAKRDLRAAKLTDRELRDAKLELERLGPERDAASQTLAKLRAELEQLSFRQEWRAYLAKKAAVQDIDERLADSPEEWILEGLAKPQAIEAERAQLTQKLAGPRERLQRAALLLTDSQSLCLAQETAIETVIGQVADRKDLMRTVKTAQQGLTECTLALDASLRRIGADDQARKSLSTFPLNTLQADADQWDANNQRFDADSLEREASPMWIVGALVGCAGIATQALQMGPAWVSLSAIGVGFALALACFLHPTHASQDAPRPGLPASSRALLAKLALQEDAIRTPQALTRIAEQLEDAQGHQNAARRHLQIKKQAIGELESLESRWTDLAEALGLLTEDLETLPNRLRHAFKIAEQAERGITQDKHERETARVQLHGVEPLWQACESKLQATRALLATAFPELADINQAFETWESVGRKRISAQDDLLRLQASPFFSNRDTQADTVEPQTALEPNALRSSITALELSTEEQSIRVGELKQRLASDRTAHVARAEESILELEGQLQETFERRDQLALLGKVLKKAEALYREENEPDVLHKAGKYLRAISQGRYTSLSYPPDDDGNPDERGLQVLSVEDGLRDVAKPLSRGTQEQIYLALRLGTLDYLDEGREKLPLILDEALVHWDHDRRESLYTVLKTVAQKRQVILFTCHESFATEAEQAMGAHLIQLPDRSQSKS